MLEVPVGGREDREQDGAEYCGPMRQCQHRAEHPGHAGEADRLDGNQRELEGEVDVEAEGPEDGKQRCVGEIRVGVREKIGRRVQDDRRLPGDLPHGELAPVLEQDHGDPAVADVAGDPVEPVDDEVAKENHQADERADRIHRADQPRTGGRRGLAIARGRHAVWRRPGSHCGTASRGNRCGSACIRSNGRICESNLIGKRRDVGQ